MSTSIYHLQQFNFCNKNQPTQIMISFIITWVYAFQWTCICKCSNFIDLVPLYYFFASISMPVGSVVISPLSFLVLVRICLFSLFPCYQSFKKMLLIFKVILIILFFSIVSFISTTSLLFLPIFLDLIWFPLMWFLKVEA